MPANFVKLRNLVIVLSAAALAACGGGSRSPMPPRAAPPWMTIGRATATFSSVDTSRIVTEGNRRVVWVRADSLEVDTTAAVAGTGRVHIRETQHRVDCGARTVEDLATILRDGSGKQTGGGAEPAAAPRPFASHPFGMRFFPTVCEAIGVAVRNRERERA
ncbi:hypothetical protein [Longimicrobium terrae]|uniref:Uncharacterized protein n=1 Tax=Longimicrobium terrae TaxID=1639882 RepID=A0A841H4K6_9BACT|nr:hypothetical protein [Longimicrobium terrae]MBB4638758.1 hypothetical protein [Longimicrobium terrae]MBB6072997.1 hypothetical protein [Longimicrobium terrae]NNC33121.1 hypothetical protein [Longimicrobium terrae]